MTKEDGDYINAVYYLVSSGKIPMDAFRRLFDAQYAETIESYTKNKAKESLEDDIRRKKEWMDTIKKDIKCQENKIEGLQEKLKEAESEYLSLKKDFKAHYSC